MCLFHARLDGNTWLHRVHFVGTGGWVDRQASQNRYLCTLPKWRQQMLQMGCLVVFWVAYGQ
jgi:hypothetical protein